MQSKLSSNGQVTIPKGLRESLGLKPGDVITYEIADDSSVVLRRFDPSNPFFDLAVSETLEEWGSEEDEEAFRDL